MTADAERLRRRESGARGIAVIFVLKGSNDQSALRRNRTVAVPLADFRP
jgi:hypothetical protein